MESKPIEFKADTKAFNDGLARANESIGNLHPVPQTPNRAHRRAVEAREKQARGWSKARLEREHVKLYKTFQAVVQANQAMLAQLLRWDEVAGELYVDLPGEDGTPAEIGTVYAEGHKLLAKLTGSKLDE